MSRIYPIFLAALWICWAPCCFAGVGPENVIVVVNAESQTSRTIANHYIHWRQIPSGNVIHLKGVPKKLRVSLSDFKDKILKPILTELNRRKITVQSKVIAYSADFPTSVNVSEHHKKFENPGLKKVQRAIASLTGATFFYRFMLADDPNYFSMNSNLYARGKIDRSFRLSLNAEKRERIEAAKADLESKKYAEAASAFEKLANEHPTLPVLAIQTADAYAQAGDKTKAIAWLRRAMVGGFDPQLPHQFNWWSANYLKESESLKPLLADPTIAKILPLLNQSPTIYQPPIGFGASLGFESTGSYFPIASGGVPYLMSCMLAVVHKNGSTVPQALEVLERASKCDHTYPKADFFFSGNKDVRSTTRMPNVPDAMVYLQNKGFKTEIFRSDLPKVKADIAGMLVGRAKLKFEDAPWKFVPGAIADNLTSYGAVFESTSQTKLTALLHAGAAMSSGTVAEPYAIQQKFPLPIMYAFYADGASAIEAFYLSVSSPYQLLIVGDPAASPYAKPPSDLVDISILDNGQVGIQRRNLGLKVPDSPIRNIELFIADQFVQTLKPAPNIRINLPEEASGVWDVRVSLVGFDSTEPRSTFTESIIGTGPLPTPVVSIIQPKDDKTKKVEVELSCAGAKSIDLMHFGEIVGSIAGEKGKLSIDTSLLGDGPIRLRPVALVEDVKVLGKRVIAE